MIQDAYPGSRPRIRIQSQESSESWIPDPNLQHLIIKILLLIFYIFWSSESVFGSWFTGEPRSGFTKSDPDTQAQAWIH